MLGLSSNDAILFLSVIYSCVDMSCEWDLFDTCQKPIHRWLLVSYFCVVAFRLTQLVGQKLTQKQGPEGANHSVSNTAAVDFLLDLRQKGMWPRILAGFSWLVALPFFVLWTLVGTFWLHDVVRHSPTCVPSDTHLWFMGLWLALCFVWIGVHLMLGGTAMLLERRIRKAEENLRSVQDSDSVSRWGEQSLASYSDLPAGEQGSGLSPEEIKALPGLSVFKEPKKVESEEAAAGQAGTFECSPCGDGEACEAVECAICIMDFSDGDAVRTLRGCSHTFHRSCIDLWLLRRADCPLCKQSVRQVNV